jgi:hypothetical protein
MTGDQIATKGFGNMAEYFRSLLRDGRHSGDAGVLKGSQSGSARHRCETQGTGAAVKAVIRARAQDLAA